MGVGSVLTADCVFGGLVVSSVPAVVSLGVGESLVSTGVGEFVVGSGDGVVCVGDGEVVVGEVVADGEDDDGVVVGVVVRVGVGLVVELVVGTLIAA
ncbi:MAG: hypothetical protein HOV78_02585 [Hamadaea sp.]|nr:hypothetical protein [Hamadaea sp.]